MMIKFKMSEGTRNAMVAGLEQHGASHLTLAGLGRIRKEDCSLMTSIVIASADADGAGVVEIVLNDVAGAIAFRCYMIAEIAAGRGLCRDRSRYDELLGAETQAAYEYVVAVCRGSGIRPCADADHDAWSAGTEWVVADGKVSEPRKTWARSAWRGRAAAHEVLAAAGLALADRGTWSPVATMLFREPVPVRLPIVLAPVDEDALKLLAA